jgi:hypothetical protein
MNYCLDLTAGVDFRAHVVSNSNVVRRFAGFIFLLYECTRRTFVFYRDSSLEPACDSLDDPSSLHAFGDYPPGVL